MKLTLPRAISFAACRVVIRVCVGSLGGSVDRYTWTGLGFFIVPDDKCCTRGAPCVADGVQQSKTFIALAAGTVRLGRGPAVYGCDGVTRVTPPIS